MRDLPGTVGRMPLTATVRCKSDVIFMCANLSEHIEIFQTMPQSAVARSTDPIVRSVDTPRWRVEDLDLEVIDPDLARFDEAIVLILVGSSFVESGTTRYASNLQQHFQGDPEVSRWLATEWEPEELQHGRALRAYVERVWPAFDWERAFRGFMRDYEPLCTAGKLESPPGLEMAARCVVETGTTALYRALLELAREPTLRTLLRHISNDEVNHYKHFYRHFRRYQVQDHSSRLAVFGALLRRSAEIGREDTDIGLRHAYLERVRTSDASVPSFEELRRSARSLLRGRIPVDLAGSMWLRPLQLPAAVERPTQRIVTALARAAMACFA